MPRLAPPIFLALLLLASRAQAAPERRFDHEPDREHPPLRVSKEHLEEVAREGAERTPLGFVQRGTTNATTRSWTSLGPSPIAYDYWSTGPAAGRISTVVVDPRNGDVAYIGAAQGGVWKTLDGGASWTVLTDGLPSLASGALALDPRNPDVVFYGTGEQHYSFDAMFGDGLFRSPDGGATWTKLASRTTFAAYTSRLVFHPQCPETLYAGCNRGFLRSLDGGATWTKTTTFNWCDDIAVDPNNGHRVYCAINNYGVLRSDDAGATWIVLGNGLPAAGSGVGRVQIALAKTNPSVVYASYAQPNGALLGFFRTNDGGEYWTEYAAPNYLGGQGWYDHALIVSPANENVCYAGGAYPYDLNTAGVVRTTNGGASWTDVTVDLSGNSIHPDQHNFAWGPDGKLWLVNDGGVWNTADGGDHWTSRNTNLAITQFYSADVHPTDPDRILGGTQDNGTVIYEGTSDWPQVISGDGGDAFFLWNQPSYYYTTYVGLETFEWFNGNYSGTVTGPWAGVDPVSFIQGPLSQDFITPNTMLAGTNRVWRSFDRGVNWSPISVDLGGGELRAITVHPSSANLIYASTAGGRLYQTSNGVSWTARHTGLPANRAINDVIVDPLDPLKLWIPVDVASGGRVYRSINGGVSWINSAGDLPSGINGLCLEADFSTSPPVLWLGTNFGIYRSDDNGATWNKEDDGIPSLAVYDLDWSPGGALIAATHGRGMWRGIVPPVAVEDAAVPVSLQLAVANPVRPPAPVEFRLPQPGEAMLEVFDLSGRRVRELARGPHAAGVHRVTWDGRSDRGANAGSGVYFYRLTTARESRVVRSAFIR